MATHACHDCGRETPHRKYCDACAAGFRATDGRVRPGRQGSGTKAHAALKAQAYEDYDGICGRCGEPIDPDQPWDLGHIVPHAAGGQLTQSNVRPEHVTCNRRHR